MLLCPLFQSRFYNIAKLPVEVFELNAQQKAPIDPQYTMSSNRVLSSRALGSVVHAGREFELRAATHTTRWTRPTFFASEAMRDGAIKAIEGSGKALPQDTARLVVR